MNKWNIRSIIKEILTAAVLLFILTNIISYIRKPELGSTQLPKIEAQLVDGSTFKAEEGKPLLLHYWAIWCPTCKLEAPNIQFVSQKYNVLTIAVNSGSDEKVKTYMKENELNFKVLNDVDGKWAKQFKVEAYPTTFIYDGKGELRFTEVGYTTIAGLMARLKMVE
ncbi:MAG: protein disulfide oxidoreductase [Sulfurovum sp.]|nr:protein disulfide oxidoreductase [Sulfurovum sp.]